MRQPIEILGLHNLKRTSCREGIIRVIMSASTALSESEIRERLEGNYDRTTFYRSFKTLVENKIIHKIVVDNQLVKYALDNSVTHKHEHAHFYCNECERVQCLDDVVMPALKLPTGYTLTEMELIIKGLCNQCSCKN
ncbi:MAG: transcriptional repressor [Bacteroidetes bacterium]|jgi:Fur family ferric uptake transcriptional regulator|nr:transcriptional repressor [Bacteroidota bacterium]